MTDGKTERRMDGQIDKEKKAGQRQKTYGARQTEKKIMK
jgi:hypothetical protein